MILTASDFLHFTIVDVVDVILVALLIFFVFRAMRGSNAVSIFVAIVSLYLLWIVVDAFNLKITSAIMGRVLDVGVLAIIVIFQPEIRRFLMKMGGNSRIKSARNFFSNIFSHHENAAYGPGKMTTDSINELCKAVQEMSDAKTGALIVLQQDDPLDDVIGTGDLIDSKISKRLIMNIFFKNSPLHDGAMIISNDKIVAARCTLPNTSQTDIPAHYGMRHRAALGIGEETDVYVILVSEETGQIRLAKGNEIVAIDNINNLKQLLMSHDEQQD
ncbi:MAG: TIGR00159 family protein [Bacteroidales bacterium]|nr:TIGR00159 family protein [Bacteroidales bacterium]